MWGRNKEILQRKINKYKGALTDCTNARAYYTCIYTY